MHLQDLKSKNPADLIKLAEEMDVENASSMRKQEIMFAILKNLAEKDEEIFGIGVLEVLQDGLGSSKYAPCPLLVNMVTAGRLGVKSGEGFYLHTKGSKEFVVSSFFRD